MRKIIFLSLLSALGIGAFFYTKSTASHSTFKKVPKKTRIKEVFEWEKLITADPATGQVPRDRLLEAWKRVDVLNQLYGSNKAASLSDANWFERGPYRVGGRTRGILIDKRAPNNATVFAAGVTGGLWKATQSNTINGEWQQINDYLPNLGITDIVQSPINLNTLYFCTGEDVRGIGVFKSTDGGSTWNNLPNTLSFTTCNRMLASTSGNVLVCTNGGLFISTDQGATWTSGIGLPSGECFDIEEVNSKMYCSFSGGVLYVSNDGGLSWNTLNTGTSGARTEFAISRSNPNVMYMITAQSDRTGKLYKSTNGGTIWDPKGPSNLAGTQAWYALTVEVNPVDENKVIVGGLDLYQSDNGGNGWTKISDWTGGAPQYVHADQHEIVYSTDGKIMYIGNDGGVFYCNNATAPASSIKLTANNRRYNVTQFYACAIDPRLGSGRCLAGSQDNGTNLIDAPTGLSESNEVIGGDGFACFIDQDNYNLMIGSLYYGAFQYSTDAGQSFGNLAVSDGRFVTLADYDDTYNTLYAQTNRGNSYHRTIISNGTVNEQFVSVSPQLPNYSAIRVSPNVNHRVYFGTLGGQIYVINDANAGTSATATVINTGVSGAISCIEIQEGNEQHLLVTFTNYGLNNNVLESKDGGATWQGVEGVGRPANERFPDMPVRWALFNPSDSSQVLLATEMGVWSTDKLDGNQTLWLPPTTNKGTPLVRVDMLQMRKSDNMVLAGTYGRGMFMSDAFTRLKANTVQQGIGYINANYALDGRNSTKAVSYKWETSNGLTANGALSYIQFDRTGTFNITLTVTDSDGKTDVSTSTVNILPNRDVPFETSASGYSGNFDVNTADFAAWNISGSPMQLGKSTIQFKNGTASGANAWVLGLTEATYQPNTLAYLYTPNFDFSKLGFYQVSFKLKGFMEFLYDGVSVEYSTDSGISWNTLGTKTDSWYNTQSPLTAFTNDQPFINPQNGNLFKNYFTDCTDLAGNNRVAFRFVIRSNRIEQFVGLAIDDFSIVYSNISATEILSIAGSTARPNGNQFANTLTWKTKPEYKCLNHTVEVSTDGATWTALPSVTGAPNPIPSKGNTQGENAYTFTHTIASVSAKPIYYYRVKLTPTAGTTSWKPFYSKIIPISLSGESSQDFIVNLWPTATVGNTINFTTFELPADNEMITIDIYNPAGQRIFTKKDALTSVFYQLDVSNLASGFYFIRIATDISKKSYNQSFLK